MTDLIKVLLVQPGLPARIAFVEKGHEALASFFDGHMTTMQPWYNPSVIVYNDRIPKNLRSLNRVIDCDGLRGITVIAGDFIICQKDSDGTLTNLTDELFDHYKKRFSVPHRFRPLPFGGFGFTREDPTDM